MSQKIPSLYVAPSKIGGRGVFTTQKIPKGSIIEVCPVIVTPKKQLKHLDKTELYNYYFQWGDDYEDGAFILGYGSLYNHSYKPNAHYLADFEMGTVDFFALKDIAAGEEIFTNYNGDPKNKNKLWFDVKGKVKKKAAKEKIKKKSTKAKAKSKKKKKATKKK